MDPYTQKLMERTRERRELLAKKMAELSPSRKRNALGDSQVQNIPPEETVPSKNSPNKRHCAREDELCIRPDTPAIPSIRSRMNDISSQRKDWSDEGITVPSVDSDKCSDTVPPDVLEPMTPKSRRSRFAALAKNISNWEDDLSHPHIKKEEVKPKKVWQPPVQPIEEPAPSKPPRTFEHTLTGTDSSVGRKESPAKPPRTRSPAPSSPRVATKSPKKDVLRTKAPSPKKSSPQVSTLTVKLGSTQNTSPLAIVQGKTTECSPSIPINETVKSPWRDAKARSPRKETTKKTPSKDIVRSLSKKRGSSDGSAHEAGPATKSPRQSDVNEPTKKPVSARLAAWQKKTDTPEPERIAEPTKTPVSARLANWQNKVDSESNTQPKQKSSPVKKNLYSTLRNAPDRSPIKSATPVAAPRQAINTETPKNVQASSPSKTGSPKKLAPAARAIQEKLEKLGENWQQNEIAEKIRHQKQADMAVLQNRWQNGVLKDDANVVLKEDDPPAPHKQVEKLPPGVIPPAPPLPMANKSPTKTPNKNKPAVVSNTSTSASKKGKRREEARDKLRDDDDKKDAPTNEKGDGVDNFENKLAAMGFEVEATPEKKVATVDLRPIKAKEAAERAANAQKNSPTKKATANIPKSTTASAATSSTTVPRSATSIYSLIKNKSAAPVSQPAAASQMPAPSTYVQSWSHNKRSSFDSVTTSEADETQSETGLSRQTSATSSQSAESCTDSYYSDTQDEYTSQTDDASEAEDYTTEDPATQSDSDLSDASGVSDLLDEALDETATESEASHPVPQPRRRVATRESSSVRRPRPATYHEERENKRAQVKFEETSQNIRRPHASGEKSGYRVAQQADKRVTWAAEGTLSSEAESEVEEKAIIYTIDQYRTKRDQQGPAPSQTIVRDSHQHSDPRTQRPKVSEKSLRQRLQELQEMVTQEQNVISQTSNALNQCCHSESSFAASQEAVECHRLILLACKKRESYLSEMSLLRDQRRANRNEGPVGSLTISDIRLPLKQDVMSRINSTPGLTSHYFVILVRHENHLISTQMVSTQDSLVRGCLDIPNLIKFQDIYQNFHVQLDIYSMHITKEPLTQTPKKKTPKKTPKKLKGQPAHMQSPGGPNAVRSTEFQLVASLPINFRCLQKTHFNLSGVGYSSPLQGTIYLKLQCLMECQVEERGFLTMFEDVSGFGAWHRRWCVLKGHFISYWKYPDDETERKMEPMGYIDLKQCITDTVGLVARDICARPNTFELVTVRRQSRGESDTLVTRCYNTMTTTKHWISADTKDDRLLWCSQLNDALSNIRAWNPDALRPIRKQSTSGQ